MRYDEDFDLREAGGPESSLLVFLESFHNQRVGHSPFISVIIIWHFILPQALKDPETYWLLKNKHSFFSSGAYQVYLNTEWTHLWA